MTVSDRDLTALRFRGLSTLGRRLPLVLAGVSMLALTACSSSGSLGTFDDAGSFEQDLLGGFFGADAIVGGEEEEPIDYSARAPLVIPPDQAQLPAPQEANAAPAGNWPVDADQARAGRGRPEVIGDNAQVSPETLAEGVGRQRTPMNLADLPDRRGLYDESSPVIPPTELRNQGVLSERLQATGPVDENGVPIRRYLVEPPSTLRTPAATASMEMPERPGPTEGAHATMVGSNR